MASGEPLGAETSIDKVLLATAEQAVFDLVADALPARDRHRRRRRQRTLARGVPLLAGRDASTAAARRSSATSSPAASSTSGTTDDRRPRPRAVRAQPARRDRAAHRRRARRRGRGARLARRARRSTRGPRCRACSSCQGEACATSSALDHVVAFAHRPRARRRDRRSRCPRSGEWQRPGPARARPRRRCAAWPPRCGRRRWSSRQPATGTWPRWSTRRRCSCGRCTASTRGSASSRCTARSTPTTPQPVDWAAAVALAQLAVAHELVGASRKALALAREHALERIQFGQPIARFQAVRHRLAETLVAIETATAVLDAAWLDQSAGDRGDGQGDRRAQRAHRRPPLPAGARRHRLHHRTRPAPLRAAHPRPRPALRLARRP